MGLIRVSSYPIICDLEHNDVVQDVIDDGWGDINVYLIEKVHWQEVAGQTWRVYIEHPATGKNIEQLVGPFETGSRNLPTPIRFLSHPLTIRITVGAA